MDEWLIHEPGIRLSFFLSVLVLVVLLELLFPRRPRLAGWVYRWLNNFGLATCNTLLLRLVSPVSLAVVAIWIEERGWGLFQLVEWPQWLIIAMSIVILDFCIWAQHVLFHKVPAFWRLHRVHHADQEYDVTTGLRFHPLEILLSFLIKLSIITMLGIPSIAVLFFEILLNATAMFNHGNIKLPASIDRLLRYFLVTPDMHRVHHSWHVDETNSNFGFNLPWWDYLMGTYRAQPRDGHTDMTIGLDLFRNRRDLRLDRLLVQPFIFCNNKDSLHPHSSDSALKKQQSSSDRFN